MTYELGHPLEFDIKAISDSGAFTGYASTFSNEDLGRDVVLPGAFAKSLQRRPAAKVKLLVQHDSREPVGIVQSLEEDSKGLKIGGRLILETTKGRETHALMKAGALEMLSIGFKTLKDRFDRAKGVRFLEELDLYEISIVTFGMNPRATIATVKSDGDRARAFLTAISQLTDRIKS